MYNKRREYLIQPCLPTSNKSAMQRVLYRWLYRPLHHPLNSAPRRPPPAPQWTTYRKMAEEAVDAVVATGRVPSNTGHCVTGRLPLRGARTFRPTLAAELGQQLKTDPLPGLGAAHDDVAAHLASSYGDRAPEVLRIAREKSLGNRLAPGLPVLEAEVAYCAAMEYSETPDDFLERRVRMAFMDASAAIAALPRVAELMGNVHGWSRERRAKEIDNARALLTRQYVPAVEAAAA
eukprot:350869-Chlamydomonas_euryale.AAC.2